MDAALGQPIAQRRGKGLATQHGFGQAGQGHAHFSSLLDNDFQKTRCANVARRAQLGHGLHLLLGLTRATGKHGAAQGMGPGFHHGARGHKVVAEAVVDQLTRSKTSCVHGPGHAPVIAPRALGFINGAWAGKHARHVRSKTHAGKAAKGVARALGLLALKQFALARHRQLGQGRTAGDAVRVHARQDVCKSLAVGLGMGHLQRQGGQQLGLALIEAALFKGVVKGVHGAFPCVRRGARVGHRAKVERRGGSLRKSGQANQRLRRL